MRFATVLICFLVQTLMSKAKPQYPYSQRNYPGAITFPEAIQQNHHSSAQANANAFSNQFGLNGFGSSAANANAQSFQSGGPLGGFGASAANSQSQGFNINNGMLNGNANFAGSQTYNFGDKKISIAYSNGWNVGPDGVPRVSNSNSISYTK